MHKALGGIPENADLVMSKAEIISKAIIRSGMRRVAETDKSFGGFEASHNGFVGNNHNGGEWMDAYSRDIPNNFDASDDHPVDAFTQNVMQNYATEGVTEEGKPDGHFFIVKAQAKALAKEIVKTHLGYVGDQNDKFISKYFDDTWHHYDVNDEGTMDALWVSTVMRALCKPVKDIDLQ